MMRRGICLLWAWLAIAVMLSPAQAETPVRVHLKWLHQFQSAGYIVALEKGYYRREGLDVRLIEGGPGKAPVETMLAGGCEFAVGDAGALLYRAEGKPVVVLASIFQHSPQVLYTPDSITRLEDLFDRRVMMQTGHLTVEVLAMLKAVGLEEGDFIRQPIGVIRDLVEGRTDAFPGYSTNEAFWLGRIGFPYRMFRPRDFGIDFYGDTLLTTEKTIRDRPEMVEAFLRATLAGWREAIRDPEAAVDLILRTYNTQHKSRVHLMFEAKGLRELMAADLVPVGLSNPDRWRAIAEVFRRQGFDTGAIDWDAFLYRPPVSFRHLIRSHPWTLAGVAGGLLLLLLGGYVVLLRRMVRRRTRDLEAARAELQRILDHLQDTYYRADADGILVWVSRSVETLLGYGVRDLLGTPASRIYAEPDGRERFLATLEAAGGAITNYETRLRRKDGRIIHVSIASRYCRDEDGRIVGVEGTVRDISDLKAAEEERRKLSDQLLQAQKMESIGVLAGGIAHDFNNLLVGVMGNAELAMLELPKDHPLREPLAGIVKAARRGSSLVRQMLAYAGKAHIGQGRQNLNTIVREMSQLLESALGANVELAIHLAEDLPDVRGDRNQLSQIIMNLITNAAEALEGQPGRVTIETGCTELVGPMEDAVVDTHQAGRHVWIRVSDTGCGMSEDTRSRIFDPFFTTKPEGTGLGLSALAGIVRSHHGALSLETAPGKGARFTIWLPALPGAGSEESVSTDSMGAFTPVQGIVLVVDDEDTVRRVARRILEREGIQVLEAADGEAALRVFRQRMDDIALVLLDLTMPKMDGAEVFRRLKQLKPDVSVLLSSGFNKPDIVHNLQREGLAGFLRKPYSRKALLGEILPRLGRKSFRSD
ncbi:MAG: ABC transporter substrate-binding protein [Mariprofundaceae bacterium]